MVGWWPSNRCVHGIILALGSNALMFRLWLHHNGYLSCICGCVVVSLLVDMDLDYPFVGWHFNAPRA